MGAHAHDAPPPPGKGLITYFLGLIAVAVAFGYVVIRPLAGEAFLFVLGFIAFFAPLLGWGVQICVGRWLPRKGDWLSCSTLLISFLCGFTIFTDVVVLNYDPGYAKEYRFNWFSIAGDGANDAKGSRRLSAEEFAAQRGAAAVVQRVLALADGEHLELSAAADHEALADSHEPSAEDHAQAFSDLEIMRDLLAAGAFYGDRLDAPQLKSLNYRFWFDDAEAVEAQWDALPASLKQKFRAWVLKARLERSIALAASGQTTDDELQLVPDYQRHDLKTAIGSLHAQLQGWRAKYGTKINLGAEAYGMAEEILAGVKLEGGNAPQAISAFCTNFALAEQALLDWRYYALDPAFNASFRSDPLYMGKRHDLTYAEDKNFQAFAIGIYIDNVTAITIFMVTLLAFLIHLFSIGYMAGDVRYPRFFATINLFTAGMIGLVLANNFLWLFVCWEIMGLCSYLLIGHYFEKKSAQEASMKAFFTTRIADTFMMIGMMMIFASAGTFLFAGSDAAITSMREFGTYMGDVQYAGAGSFFAILGSTEMLLGGIGATAIGLLCFLGPAGKSAQFPFHVWLPDAMEGPTPVSAMIHAACMVSAGVYLTARLFPLFTPDVLQVIAIVGGFTALAAGTVGLVQTDLKKVLAYSTISQLGYMFMGIGVGAWWPAFFHMIAHAFFKALMFLGSGSVILGCHHEQEMPKMGGLWKKMPITTWTFWIGNASIIGLPFFFAGYYSKEAILTDAIIFGKSGGTWLPYLFGAVGAGLTTFYMCRLMWLTFHGKPRDKHLYDHVKESPWTVTFPLVVIAIGSIFISWPIGAHKDSVNLGLTNLTEHHNVGPQVQGGSAIGGPAKRVAQAPNESWMAVRVKKPASIYSRDLVASEYPAFNNEARDLGHGVMRNQIDALYADKHGREGFSNLPAWQAHDLVVQDPATFFGHGKAAGHAEANAGDHGHHDLGLNSHAVHEYHDAHHGAHVMAFMVALVMLGLGISLSWFFYMGPLANKDWVGHQGFLFRVKKVLRNAYYMDAFYDATILRVNRWLREFCSWFDRTVVDGVVNWFGTWTRWMCRVCAKIDHWLVDGSVRGIGNATIWSGEQSAKSVTGRIQDYVFLLVSAIVILYLIIVLF